MPNRDLPTKLCAALVAIWLPPIGVAVVEGCTWEVCLNVYLTLLFYFPGLIHAYIVIFRE